MRSRVLALVTAIVVAACVDATPPPSTNPAGPALATLDLQVRNSGMRGGYLWLSMADQRETGRWHQFGMAQFMCVTCPRAYGGLGTGYEIAVYDEACAVRARFQTLGGPLLVEIDLGPTIELVPAPPLGDWMPENSLPADAGTVPCSAP